MTRSLNSLKWLALCCALALTAAPAAWAREDNIKWVPGQRMAKAVSRVVASSDLVNKRGDFGYDYDVCLLAAFLPTGDSSAFTRNLVKGQEYLILGGGDANMDDMDLEVKDENGVVVGSDTLADAAPVVRFTAKSNGRHTIKATAYKADRGSFACVVIMRKNGWNVPVRNLTDAVGGLLGRCDRFDSRTTDKVYFHDVRNQWALYGAVLRQGEDMTITNIDMGTGKRAVLAGGDGVATDLDLFCKDRDDKLVAQDVDPDAEPILALTTTRYQGAKLTFKNVKSRGPSLVVMTVLRQEK